MHHFFVPAENIHGSEAAITGQDVNHIVNVLRIKPGEEITVNDGSATYLCRVCGLSGEKVLTEIIETMESTELCSRIYLFQGIPKNDKMEMIIQKSVELGVYQILPVDMKRCVSRIEPGKKQETKRTRWRAISESAAKQSKRTLIPEIGPFLGWQEALSFARTLDVLLLPYEKAEGMAQTRKILQDIKPGQSVGIFIGPEGGFEESEVREAAAAGAKPLSLGKRILRTETAGPALLSMLVLYLDELRT